MATPEAQSEAGWESWQEPVDFINHKGQRVDVRDKRTGSVILENGLVTLYTDLTGTAAILEHGRYGEDTSGQSVVRALNLPPVPGFDRRTDSTKFRDRILKAVGDPYERTESERKKWEEKYREWTKDLEFRVVR